MEPRGIRNNNPGNIVQGANFDGEVQSDDQRFAQFTSPEMGIRAMSRTLDTYRDKHGLNTIEGILNRWAPNEENDTAKYVNFVAMQLDKYPDEQLTTADRESLVTAMITFENGSNPYTQAVIQNGIASAGTEFDDAPPPAGVEEFDFGPVVNDFLSEAGVSKQAFMAATLDVMGEGSSWASAFTNIKAELRSSNESPTMRSIMSKVRDNSIEEARGEARQVMLDQIDLGQQEMRIKEILKEAEFRGENVEEAFRQAGMFNETTDTPIEEEVQSNFIESYQETRDSYSDLRDFIEMNIPIGEGVQEVGFEETAETAVGAFIPGWGPMMASVGRQVFPEAADEFSDNLLPGDVAVAMRNRLRSLPVEEQKVAIIKLREAAKDMGDTLLGNDWIAVDIYMSFLDGLIFDDENNSFDQALFNAFSLIEVIPFLGSVASRAARTSMFSTLRSRISSQIGQMNRTSPSSAKRVYDSASEELSDEQVKEVLGDDGAVLGYEHGYPKSDVDEVRAGFDTVERFNVNDDPIIARDESSMFFRDLERKSARERFQNRVQNALEESNATVYGGKMGVRQIDGGYSAKYRIGHTESRGFATAKQAEAAANSFREARVGNDSNYQLLYKNERGNYVKYNADRHPSRGEFLIEMNQRRTYAMDDIGFYDIENDFEGVTGWFSRYLDKDSLFARWITAASNRASDRSEAIRKALTEIRLPYERLPRNKRLVAMRLLTEQSDNGKWLEFDEIMDRTGDLDVARAILSVRRFTRGLRQLTNARMRSALVDEGQMAVEVKFPRTDGQKGAMFRRSVFGRVIDDVNNVDRTKIGRVYDPEAGNFVDFTDEALDEFYESGGRVIRARGDGFNTENGGQKATYILYRRGSRRVSVDDLPEYVVREREGYIPRIYNSPYVVTQTATEVVNGVERTIRRPLAFAATEGDARAHAAVREGADGIEIVATDNLPVDDPLMRYINTDSIDFYEESGQLFLSERNDRVIPTITDAGFDGKRGLEDIDEALRIAEQRVANRHSMRHLINIMTRRWENTYGEAFGDANNKMPVTGKLPEGKTLEERALRDSAITMRDHIQLLMGVDDSWTKATWRSMMMRASDWVSTRSIGNRLARKAGRKIADFRDSSPLDWARQAAFTQFIIANPIRQLMLQAQQASVYLSQEGALRYFASGEGWKHQLGLTWGLATRNLNDWPRHRRHIAERLGMEPEEYEKMLDAYIESGLAQAVDTHQYAVGMSAIPMQADQAGYFRGDAGNRWLRPFKQAGSFARRIGFDAGEHWQLQTAWLTERNRWLLQNPGKDWTTTEALSDIAASARSMSFNMSRAGTLGTQQGAMSSMFQFMTHSIKAAQVLIPPRLFGETIGKLSNARYTRAQRKALWMQQTMLYGTGWLGYDQFINDVAVGASALAGEPVEIPEDVRIIVREGLLGTAVNYGAALMDNPELYDEQLNVPIQYLDEAERANVLFSDNFAPFSGMHSIVPNRMELDGNPITKIYEAAFLNGSTNPVEFFFGPAHQTVTTVGDKLTQAAFIMGETRLPWIGNGNGQLDLDDLTAGKVSLVVQEVASLAPGVNNFWKARLMDRTGRFMTAAGNYGVEGTTGEAWAKALLGLETVRERQNRDLSTQLRGVIERQMEPTNLDYQNLARAYYDRIVRAALRQYDGEITTAQANEMLEVSSIANYMLFEDEVERAMFYDSLRERIFSDIMDNGDVRLIKLLTSGRSNNQISTMPEAITRIENMAPFPGKEAVLRNLRVYSELHHGRPPATSP